MAQQPTHSAVADWLADTGYVAANKANAISTLNRFHAWCTAHELDLLEVRRRDVRAWLDERASETNARTGRRISQATARVDWRQVRAFYRWCATAVSDGGGGELKVDPTAGMKGPKVTDKPQTKRAAIVDIRALEVGFAGTTLGRRNAAMVSLMFRSGLRVGELPWLNLADLTRRPDGRATLAVPITKSDEPRQVPLHPETVRYLDRYLRRRGPLPGPLFMGDTARTDDVNGRLTARAVQDVVKRATGRLGLGISPHQLRRTFTSEYLRSGGDTLSLEVIGGWSDPRMPRRYLADEEAAASLDRAFDVMDRQMAAEPAKRRLRRVR